ncbi:hypothetical protein [Providencia alcalifaciens]|uniref:hypothetical protein n=1 Tax=Providencia alcalifaciens TaxID=126385 RepID=UPI003D99B563
MPASSGIQPGPLSRHTSSVARLCSLSTVALYPAGQDGSCGSHKRSPTPARTTLSVPSVSGPYDAVENMVVEARRKSHWDVHPARDKADEQASNRCCHG